MYTDLQLNSVQLGLESVQYGIIPITVGQAKNWLTHFDNSTIQPASNIQIFKSGNINIMYQLASVDKPILSPR